MFQIDFFPSEFRLNIDYNKGKRTSFGGVVTLLIALLGVGYFAYIVYAWVSNVMQASYQQQYTLFNKNMTINHPPIMFAITKTDVDGTTPVDLTYYQTEILFARNNFDPNKVQVNMVNCGQYFPEYAGYVCPDMSDPSMQINPDMWITIRVYYCFDNPWIYFGNGNPPACQSLEDQYNLLILPNIEFHTIYVSQQFDRDTRTMSTVFQTRRNIYDPTQFVVRLSEPKFAEINIDTGVLFEHKTTHYSFDEFLDNTANLNKDVARTRYTEFVDICIFYTEFTMHPQMKQSRIQFPRFGQVLAEFNSIFSVVLMLSMVSQFVSYKETAHYLKSVITRHYYGDAQSQVLDAPKGPDQTGNSNSNSDKANAAQVAPLQLHQQHDDDQHHHHQQLQDAKAHIERLQVEYTNYEKILEDLIRLKKAVALLYTPEQWSMLDKTAFVHVQSHTSVKASVQNETNPLHEIDTIDRDQGAKREYQLKFARDGSDARDELTRRISASVPPSSDSAVRSQVMSAQILLQSGDSVFNSTERRNRRQVGKQSMVQDRDEDQGATHTQKLVMLSNNFSSPTHRKQRDKNLQETVDNIPHEEETPNKE